MGVRGYIGASDQQICLLFAYMGRMCIFVDMFHLLGADCISLYAILLNSSEEKH